MFWVCCKAVDVYYFRIPGDGEIFRTRPKETRVPLKFPAVKWPELCADHPFHLSPILKKE